MTLLASLSGPFAMAGPDEKSKVLIINSDHTVEKYNHAQKQLQANLDASIAGVTLSQDEVSPQGIEKAIKDKRPDIIYCIGTKAYTLTREVSNSQKVVFSSIINWRKLALNENTFGVASEPSPGFKLNLYKYFFPNVKRIGILYSRTYNNEWMKQAKENARDVGITLVTRRVTKGSQVKAALLRLLPDVDAVWLISDPTVLQTVENVEQIFKSCHKRSVPVFTYDNSFELFGATLVISADVPTASRQVAGIIQDLLQGRAPEERVVDPIGTEIAISMEKIEAYGLKLNQDALDSVNRIFE